MLAKMRCDKVYKASVMASFCFQSKQSNINNKVWSVICKMAGRAPSGEIRHIQVDGNEITEEFDIANSIPWTQKLIIW